MKSRASLVLMELLVMVLVFAIAAAVCLGLFARADAIAEETARRDAAVVLAQNAAELRRAGRDPSVLDTGEFSLEAEDLPPALPGLGRAEIRVLWNGEVLCSLTVGWQEVEP